MSAAMSERFEMRLDQETLDKVDAWRSEEDGVPSRAEAVRRLVEAGLSRSDFDQGQKLILLLLCQLTRHLKIDGGIDPAFVESALFDGHTWALDYKYPGVFGIKEVAQSTVNETVEVMQMWSIIEKSFARLSKKEQALITKEFVMVQFDGFDGNHEAEHMAVAGFLIDELERFEEFKGRDLNSHSQRLDGYRRMLADFRPLLPKLTGGGLNTDQLIQILAQRRHPNARTP